MRSIFIHLQLSTPNTITQQPNTMTSNTQCFKMKAMSVPDELYWYNNNTNWDALTLKEFREIMIRMETLTTEFYSDFAYPSRSAAAIRKFWADEWGCEYLPESGVWRDLESGTEIKSETQKKAERDVAKALKKEAKAAKEAAKEAKAAKKALRQQQAQTQQQVQTQQPQYDSWFDEEEEAYAEAYAQARAQEDQMEQAQTQAYLDSLIYTSDKEEVPTTTTRISCQPVLYLEELTEVRGDPDWRAYIYYDERIRCYVLKGSRRSLRSTSKKTVYPEVKLCFRSSNDLASYLCSSTDALLNVSLYAISTATVKDATFAELYSLPARGYKTELFGYDQTRPRYSTFVNYLRMVRTVDATHSTFASF